SRREFLSRPRRRRESAFRTGRLGNRLPILLYGPQLQRHRRRHFGSAHHRTQLVFQRQRQSAVQLSEHPKGSCAAGRQRNGARLWRADAMVFLSTRTLFMKLPHKRRLAAFALGLAALARITVAGDPGDVPPADCEDGYRIVEETCYREEVVRRTCRLVPDLKTVKK